MPTMYPSPSIKLITITLALLTLSACSMDKMMVNMSMPMIDSGIEAMNYETDLQLAEDSMPANLSMLNGMINLDPENAQLHTFAAQAYYGFSYGFNEDNNPERGSAFYLRGLKHGLTALELNGAQNLRNTTITDFEVQVGKMDKDDVAAIFWTASNWAKWIDMHRNDAEAIAQLARATALMQRVIELDDTFYHGGAHMYFGVYYGSRAPLLGGNFEKSRQYFERAGEITGGKLLIVDLLQAQYLARQQQDQEDFHNRLTAILNAPDDLMPELALQNQIAKRKAALLLKKENKWF
ncbi:MAG: TRAP transporter TatT component family protein [Gammaproteobacteria bacterium]